MRKLTFIIALLFVQLVLNAQQNKTIASDSLKNYLDKIVNIVQRNSLFQEGINWQIIKDSVYQKSEKAQNIEGVIPAIQYIFRAIGDKHGALIYKGKWYGNPNQNSQDIRKELLEQLKSGRNNIKTKIFKKHYGYIQIPAINAMNQSDINKYAQQIQDSVCKLKPENLKGWIIDLRLNTGGNMYPMIAGIANLIGDGFSGSFVDGIGETKTKWNIKGGELFFDNSRLTEIERKCSINKLPKIAVLISQVTSSSGEATAIALKGRGNTKFFGEKTSGYVTANNIHQIDSNSMLLVAESYEADRNNLIYKDFVRPDVEIVEGDNFYDLNKDLKIKAGLNWLQNSRKKDHNKIRMGH